MKQIVGRIKNFWRKEDGKLDTVSVTIGADKYLSINAKQIDGLQAFGAVDMFQVGDVVTIDCEKYGRGTYAKMVGKKKVQMLTKNYKAVRISQIRVTKHVYSSVSEDDVVEDVPFKKVNKKKAPAKRKTAAKKDK